MEECYADNGIKINHLLENLEAEDYDKAVSYIEFLASTRKKKNRNRDNVRSAGRCGRNHQVIDRHSSRHRKVAGRISE